MSERTIGASKVAKLILGRLDRRMAEPIGILIRFWGWIFVGLLVYLTIFNIFREEERFRIYLWIACFVFYQIILEVSRKILTSHYDATAFRVTRIIINIIFATTLVSITSTARYLLVGFYIAPISASIAYFAKNNWLKVGVICLVCGGVYIGGVVFSLGEPLTLQQFLIVIITLIGLGYGFEIFLRIVILSPNRMMDVSRRLYQVLDLQRLVSEILRVAIEITQAQRGLLIVIGPRDKRYVAHVFENFQIRAGRSVEDLANKCIVIVRGQPFESTDLLSTFGSKNIYNEFFYNQPLSVLAEPVFNREGIVIGVINVAHDRANAFDSLAKNQFREFTFLVNGAIENSLEHRDSKLREAQSREVGERFVSANTEDEVIRVLLEEVQRQIPSADMVVLHRFMPDSEDLIPVVSLQSERKLGSFSWSNQQMKERRNHLRLGYGIAGHALMLRETVLVQDTDLHPWFVRLDNDQVVAKSLLVAPLFNREDDSVYGTLSLESNKQSAFDVDDEAILAYLAAQASLALAKIRDFQIWREQGGTLRKVLEQIRSYDIQGTEEELCNQIAHAATKLLGFKIARIRLLSDDSQLVTVAISGVSKSTASKLLDMKLPFSELEKFLSDDYRAGSSYLIHNASNNWKELANKYFYIPKISVEKREGWTAYDALLTPLIDSSGAMFGLLTLDMPITGTDPTQQTLELIGVFASSASWIIELSRSQRRLADQQYRTQSFIDTISQELAKGRDLATIGEVIVQVGAKLLSAEGCSLFLVRGNELELTHSNYLANTDYVGRRKPISAHANSGLTAWVAATGKALYLNNQEYKQHPAWAGETEHLRYMPSKSCQSLLLAPIKDKDDKVIGVLTLENKKTLAGRKEFDENDMARLLSLANEFAKALEVIGLYEDIKEWERTGLADDLHDLINWYHSGVVMWIEALAEWLKRGNIEKVNELMPELLRHSHSTVLELKTLHTNVLTKSLEAGNLQLALQETVSAWVKRTVPKYKEEMKIRLECPKNLDMPVGLRNTMIRIAALAFSNAIQHSGIMENSNVEISIIVEQEENIVKLSVIDTGRGMRLGYVPEGYGLPRMRQLAEKLNSWDGVRSNFKIESEVNKGTKVMLQLEFLRQKVL